MVSKPGIDIAKLVNRREQLAYEHHLARATYAYGVDLRRAAWLDRSTIGDPLMRSVDRRWNGLTADLGADILQPGDATIPSAVMDELVRLVRLLHAPWATVRLLKPAAADAWPLVTPLGTTKGGAHWLVINGEKLNDLPRGERAFLLGAGLAHLQCGHGPLFTAHVMAYRARRGAGLVRTLLKPWSRVAMFSADRAGLLAAGGLEEAQDALRAHADTGVDWLPPAPDLAQRTRALEDFSKSRLLTRLRLGGPQASWTLAPRLAQPDAPTTTAQEGATDEAPAEPKPQTTPKPDTSGADSTGPSAETGGRPGPKDPVAEAEAEGERLAAARELEDDAREKHENELAEARAKEKALAEAWPLARCDQRLTRRLGIL